MKKMFTTHNTIATLALALALITGCKENDKPAIVSAEKTSFDQVTAKLDKGGSLYAYLSTEKTLSGISDFVGQLSNACSKLPGMSGDDQQNMGKGFKIIGHLIQESGVGEISGVGMSSIAREPDFYYTKSVVYHYPGKGSGFLWSVFGKEAHPLAELDMLPQTTALATSFDMDLPLLWSHIQQVVKMLDNSEATAGMAQAPAQFKEATGLDLDAVLHSLGGEYGLIITLDPAKMVSLPLPQKIEIPSPAVCLLFKVNSNLIYDRVAQALTNNDELKAMIVKTDEPDLKMLTVNVPPLLPIELRPCVARIGDYLLVASTDSLVRQMLAVKNGKTNGFVTTAEFKRLAQGIPTTGNSFSLMTGVISSMGDKLQDNATAGLPIDPATTKAFQKLFSGHGKMGIFNVAANGPDGWEGFANGNVSPSEMLAFEGVAVGSFAAALILPAIAHARQAAMSHTDNMPVRDGIEKFRVIELAKEAWARQYEKPCGDSPASALVQSSPLCESFAPGQLSFQGQPFDQSQLDSGAPGLMPLRRQ